MTKKFGPQIKKLQRAINDKYKKNILINKTQFYSDITDQPVEMIIIKQAVWDPEKGKYSNIELFKSSSDIQIVLWLRDYWYELNGWEIPDDNKEWKEARRKYEENH